MREIKLSKIKAEDYGDTVIFNGIVSHVDRVLPKISEIIFKCPNCFAQIPIKQYREISKPSVCNCGHRGTFEVKDKRYVNCSHMILSEIVEPEVIHTTIELNDTNPGQKILGNVKTGDKIEVIGNLDFRTNGKNKTEILISYEHLTKSGNLTITEKENILMDYMKKRFSAKIDNRLIKDMGLRGLTPEDVTEVIDGLKKLGKIQQVGKREISLIFTKDEPTRF